MSDRSSASTEEPQDVAKRIPPPEPFSERLAAVLAQRNQNRNPLLEAARPLLRAQADMPEYLEAEPVILLRSLLEQELHEFQTLCEQANIRRDHMIGARYCLCTALDEAAMQTAWGRSDSGAEWSTNGQYRDGSTAPAAPAPSLIYEMLRLGRAVGEPMPANVKFGHWRKVATPDGIGWINLNAPKNEGYYGATPYAGISVYSDADFSHWAGWSLIDDDATPDSLCESPTVKRWLDLDGDGHVTHAEAKEALHNGDVKKRMSKAICKFPIEWSRQHIDARWGWLKSPHEAWPAPLTTEDFDRLKAHIEAVAFWDDIQAPDLPPAAECWHFPPKAFIAHLRKCAWLSKAEMQQLLPSNIVRQGGHNQYYWEPVPHDAGTDTIIRDYRPDLNKTLRKYGITTPLRMAAFFAQATVETGWFSSLQEGGQHPPPVHHGWHGRGFLQLTAPQGDMNQGNNNYYNYFRWRGRNPDTASPEQRTLWRNNVENNPDDAAQSAGFYWVKTQFGPHSEHAKETAQEYADQASSNVRTLASVAHGEHVYYRNETARRTAAMVNIPGAVYGAYAINGLTDRYCAYANAVVVLADTPAFPDARSVAGEEPEHFQRRKPW